MEPVMVCLTCGASVPGESTYCSKCKSPLVPGQSPGSALPEAQTDGKAVASLILGIFSALFCFNFLLGIPAIILGHISRSSIRKSTGRLKGNGIARTGLILGYLSLLVLPFFFMMSAILHPYFTLAHKPADESTIVATVRGLNTAQTRYRASYPDVGYAPDIATLGHGSDRKCDSTSPPTAKRACLIDDVITDQDCGGTQACWKRGYSFIIQADEQKPHQQYVITVTPIASDARPKNYCSTSDGVIRSEKANPGRTTLYTAAECAAITPLEDP